MFGNLKIMGVAIGGVMLAGTGLMYQQSLDLKANYTLVDARITAVSTDCFIKSGRTQIVEKDTEKLAYMDCRLAPAIAVANGLGENDVRKRAMITYRYTSPVDRRPYTGTYTREGSGVEGLVKGKTIRVHAHNTEPAESRTTKANLFIEDSGV